MAKMKKMKHEPEVVLTSKLFHRQFLLGTKKMYILMVVAADKLMKKSVSTIRIKCQKNLHLFLFNLEKKHQVLSNRSYGIA